jgi:predicted helicase
MEVLTKMYLTLCRSVSINIFIKKKNKSTKLNLSQVFHFNLYGKRDDKYDFLNKNSLKRIEWNKLNIQSPNFFMVEKDFENIKIYEKYIELRLLFIENSMGIATGKDDELVAIDKTTIEIKYIKATQFFYRPFDVRYTIFDNNILQRARFKLMNNYVLGSNLGLNIVRQSKLKGVETLISNNITNRDFITNHTYNFPLYLYSETVAQQSTEDTPERVPNLNMEKVNQIAKGLNLTFVPELENGNVCFANNNEDLRDEFKQVFAPIDLLDYIYAVLHSPTYREKYKEFLKIDFPRVPYPKDATTFWKLVELGRQIREIHLLESPEVENYITQYPEDGNNVVGKIRFISTPLNDHISTSLNDLGNVYINDTQYFANVPEVAWNFYIGGYQPAQKWLKDRKERALDFEDILHYQKIIVALTETDRLMKEIDKVEIES